MGYGQSVTCLADDPQNLETLSSTLRTPGILSQTNNSIHKQRCTGKTQIRRSNQKVQLKNSGLQKRITSNGEIKLKLQKKQDPFTNLD